MKNILVIAFILMLLSSSKAQTPDSLLIVANQIVAEATTLYKSEMASWYGTDLFVDKYKDKQKRASGYFSYSENGVDKCIFYTNGDAPKVLATIEFSNGVYSVEAAKSNANERDFTDLEKNLHTIRAKATARIETDTLFESYKNTNFNIVPIVDKNQRKVYVMTGPQQTGVVIMGNDYEIDFNDKNEITHVRKIHSSIIPLEYSGEKEVVGAMHTHLATTGDFITATDVCTLMLYAKTAKWKQHYVMSEKYVSIWTAEKNHLLILTKEIFDKIGNDSDKRNKKKKKN
jgi:hypothetical protein